MSAKSGRKPRRSKAAAQAEFAFKANGGARPGSGRKRNGPRPSVPHRPRGRLPSHVPALVTVRLLPGLASLRRPTESLLVRSAMMLASRSCAFGVVHYSIQTNHLHLIVEARDRHALSAGMKGLLVRIARSLNRLWNRRGSIFADRYHARALRTPREVRHALVYVLHNARKHGITYAGADACSSGPWFDGWDTRSAASGSRAPSSQPAQSTETKTSWNELPSDGNGKVQGPSLGRARTWLLAVGWKRWGLIGFAERPAAPGTGASRNKGAR